MPLVLAVWAAGCVTFIAKQNSRRLCAKGTSEFAWMGQATQNAVERKASVYFNTVGVWRRWRISNGVCVWLLRFGSIIERMVIDMNAQKLNTVAQLRAFFERPQAVQFEALSEGVTERYAFIETVAKRLC